MRKYKKVSQCPEELQKIFYWVNGIKNEAQFDEAVTLCETLVELEIEGRSEEEMEKILKTYFNKKFFAYLTSGKQFSFQSALRRFTDIIGARPFLLSICKTNSKEMKERGKDAFTKNGYSLRNKESLFYKGFERPEDPKELYPFDYFTGTLTLDSKGNIRPRLSGFIEICSKYNIPFVRIRMCPVCNNIFWAKKLNAKTCGNDKCSDSLSQRSIREKKKNEINFKRRQAYAYKKAIEKEGKANVNL